MGFTVDDMLHNKTFPGGFELLTLKDSDRKAHVHLQWDQIYMVGALSCRAT